MADPAAAHSNTATSPLFGGGTGLGSLLGLFGGGLGGGGGGGGLGGSLGTALTLGSIGDLIESFTNKGKRNSGSALNSLLPALLLSQQFGGFGGRRRGSQTRVLGQDTPTEGTGIQTTPEAGVVAPIGPSESGLNTSFGLQGTPGLGGLGGGLGSNFFGGR